MSEYNNKNTLLKWRNPFWIFLRWMNAWMNAWEEDDLWLRTSWRLWKISWSRLNNMLERSSLWMLLLFSFRISLVYYESSLFFFWVFCWSQAFSCRFWILLYIGLISTFWSLLFDLQFLSPFEIFYSNKKQEKII